MQLSAPVKGFFVQLSSIGERLKSERERLGLSQTEFGLKGAVSKRSQIMYEQGKAAAGADYLAAIAMAGADVQFVLTGRRSAVASIDGALLRVCLEGVEEGLHKAKREMAPDKKAELILRLYELHQSAESPPQRATILQFIKRAA